MDLAENSKFLVDIKPGDELRVGDVLIQMKEKKGSAARIVVFSPRTSKIEKNKQKAIDS
jgi:hypothetical protein